MTPFVGRHREQGMRCERSTFLSMSEIALDDPFSQGGSADARFCMMFHRRTGARERPGVISPCGRRHDHGKRLRVRKLCCGDVEASQALRTRTDSAQHNPGRNIFPAY